MKIITHSNIIVISPEKRIPVKATPEKNRQ